MNNEGEPSLIVQFGSAANICGFTLAVTLEVCAAFPAMRALREGYEAYVAVDASGTFNETKRETGLMRLAQSGVVVADGSSLMVEILADNASPEAMPVYSALGMDWATLVTQVRTSVIASAT